MAEKNKKTFKMPHTFVIMMVIILFATLLTWIIPAGQYVRTVGPMRKIFRLK